MSVRQADRQVEEADRGHQELNRLYDMAKERIDIIKTNGTSGSRQLSSDVKEVQMWLRSMQAKIGLLKNLSTTLAARQEKQKVEVNLMSHEKQLNQLQRQLRDCTEEIRKEIANEERKTLLQTSDGNKASVQRRIGNPKERASRLSDLVSRMAEQVGQSEQTMGSLVHSSSVLAQTHSEFENQAGHIQTGSKLLSKYEQREFTEKILLVLALLLYIAVVYYILQKRLLNRFWIF